MGLAGSDERVHHRGPDGVLLEVVVDEPVPVVDIHCQLGEAFVDVLHGLPDQRALRRV